MRRQWGLVWERETRVLLMGWDPVAGWTKYLCDNINKSGDGAQETSRLDLESEETRLPSSRSTRFEDSTMMTGHDRLPIHWQRIGTHHGSQ